MKKSITSVIAVCSIALLSACGTSATTSTTPAKSAAAVVTTAPEVPVVDTAPYSWNGTWVSDPTFMSAKILNDTITISIVSEDSTSLYWQGTWASSTKAKDDVKIISEADVKALSASLLGSQDKTKTFTYANDELTFAFSMMGTTKTVHVKK